MLLDSVNTPEDLRKLPVSRLEELCREVREYMIDCCSRNPGHLASSLGTVEAIVALHYVYNTPEDKIIFDVGHQAYAHKILTGRKEAFRTLRTAGGLSGFPKMSESEYDAFGVGHSSTSVSAALGYAEAARLTGRDAKAVAVIGDGAMTGGLAFEGLNNAGMGDCDILVILNDNNRSIDANTGGLHNHLLKLTTSVRYNRMKEQVWSSLGETGLRSFIQRWLRSLKSWIVKGSRGDMFEALGLRYFGPVDGNDVEAMVNVLRKLRSMKGPKLLHILTTKGKGYAPAEADPTTWHAPGRFNPKTGERECKSYTADRYQDVFGEVLCDLAARDSRVVGITPAMATGCGMNLLAERMPERFYDVGIEEEHAVTFSAGLAAGGLRPFCNIYSSFAQRAYDQIIHDVALQKLPVVLCFDRAGLVGEDGATHQGVFDMSAFRSVPDIIISTPKDELELKNLMYSALRHESGPYIIRYPRGTGEGTAWREAAYEELSPGKAEELLEGSRTAIVCCGPAVSQALLAARGSEGSAGVFNFRFIKPLDTATLDRICSRYERILTVEDGVLAGGLYGTVCEYVASKHPGVEVRGAGVGDEFPAHAKQSEQRSAYGLTAKEISELIA